MPVLSTSIERLGIRHSGSVGEGCRCMINQQFSSLSVGGGGEDYAPSSNIESEAAVKIVGRRIQKGST